MGDANLKVHVVTPFGACDVLALVTYEGGEREVQIRQGRYEATLPGRPLRLRFLDEAVESTETSPSISGDEQGGVAVTVDQLFGDGVDVPASGELNVLAVWGTPCHQRVETDEGRRFGSFEHQMCANTVGLDKEGQPESMQGAVAPLNKDELLRVGNSELRFGDIIALAGDFYAFYDARAVKELSWAWPELGGFTGWLSGRDYREPSLASAEAKDSANILEIIKRDKDADHGVAGEMCQLVDDSVKGTYPARRYLALASQNYCHFGSQPADGTVDDERNLALQLYRAYHKRALEAARAAGDDQRALGEAFACDAFGCHFLTDLFASGHMRVPRRELGEKYGILIGALRKSHAMHAEDNAHGLWVAARGSLGSNARIVWRAYGDGMLRTDQAATHLAQVTEAVRLSAREVFAASCGVSVMENECAEWWLPHPLAAGETPRASDQVLGDADPTVANHYPLYWLLPTGDIATRVGKRHESRYRFKTGLLQSLDIEFGQVQ